MLRNYLKDTGGNVAMMFGATVLVLLAGAGAALDYSGMSKNKLLYQSMADAAVLAAASSGEQDEDTLRQIAEDIVNSHNVTGRPVATHLDIVDGSTIRVEVSAGYDMVLMNLFGRKAIDISVGSEAPPRADGKVNLALVLDVTDSMEDGGKIGALRDAANQLVDSLSEVDGSGGSGPDGNTMFSVVPFARYVHLPLSTATAPWMEIIADEVCWTPIDMDNSTGCSDTTSTSTWTDDSGNTQTSTSTSTTCTNYAYLPEICNTPTWNGCMGSRDFPWNTRDHYGGVRMRGLAHDGVECDHELLPLTNSVSTVKDRIDSLETNDRTYIPSGLIWGWRTLTPTMPFTEANTPDKNERKNAMLLMSDGGNTRSLSVWEPGFHWGDDVDDANAVTETICSEIKADGIIIYTVAFDFDDADAKTILQNCATDSGKFFDADDAGELMDAFEHVGLDLAQVRISK